MENIFFYTHDINKFFYVKYPHLSLDKDRNFINGILAQIVDQNCMIGIYRSHFKFNFNTDKEVNQGDFIESHDGILLYNIDGKHTYELISKDMYDYLTPIDLTKEYRVKHPSIRKGYIL